MCSNSSNKLKLERMFKIIQGHEKRITALEENTTDESNNSPKNQDGGEIQDKKHLGPTGGTKFLISKGFFKEKRDLGTVSKELQKNNYYYSRQAVNAALNGLSKQSGPLVVLKERKKKEYVERK